MNMPLLHPLVRTVAALGFTLGLALAAQAGENLEKSAEPYIRPSAAEALAFLRALPPITKKIEGKKTSVQPWADKTVDYIRTVREIAPGGHSSDGAHLEIRPADWRYFTAFESLEIAKLYELGGVDDEAAFHLGHLPASVKYLFVETASLSDAGVRHFQRLKNLEFLGIGWTKTITDAALEQMAAIGSLREILVSGCKGIDGHGVAHLSRLKHLRILRIAATSVTDATLPAFRDLPIEELTLAQNNVTGAALRRLLADPAALPKLKKLDLKKTAVTETESDALIRLRPGLVIAR